MLHVHLLPKCYLMIPTYLCFGKYSPNQLRLVLHMSRLPPPGERDYSILLHSANLVLIDVLVVHREKRKAPPKLPYFMRMLLAWSRAKDSQNTRWDFADNHYKRNQCRHGASSSIKSFGVCQGAEAKKSTSVFRTKRCQGVTETKI